LTDNLPVIRSFNARALFLATAAVTVALLLWTRQLRTGVEGLTPIFFILFTYFDYRAAMGMLLILVAAVLVPVWPGMRPLLRWIGNHPLLVGVGTAAVMCLGALFLYRNHPLSMDEYAQYFQSQVFAAGHLAGQFPAPLLDWLIPSGSQSTFLNVSKATGQVTSIYLPSFALLLTPFTWLGIPWACNPVLSGLTVVVIHRLALRLFDDREVAGLAVLFTIASPVFFADGISYYSMTAHMLANATYVLLLLQPTPRRLFAAGVVGSVALTLHNPMPHLLFALPWGIWVLTRARSFQNVLWLIAGYVPLCLLLGLGWYLFSADLAHGEQVAATNGSALSQITSVFTLPTATVLLARAIGVAKVWLWAVPGLLLLAGFGAWKWRQDTGCRLLVASAVTTFAGYFIVLADQGHGWGFRYFHSAWFVLPLLAAAPFASASKSMQESTTARDDGLRTFVVASALLSLVFAVSTRGLQIHEFMTDHLSQLPAYTGSESRIQFIDPSESLYGYDLVQNDPYLRNREIRMLSRGPAANAELMRTLRADFHRVFADASGEVWSAAPVAPRTARRETRIHP
jgi:hypothetical protein